MGFCIAFGPQIREGCNHAMVAASNACYCADCGVKCTSKFSACREVWAGKPAIPSTFVELSAKPKPASSGNGSAVAPVASNGAGSIRDNGSASNRDKGLSADVGVAAAPPVGEARGAHQIENSLAHLRGMVTQLMTTVEELVEAERGVSGRQDALEKSVRHIDQEVANVSERVERLTAGTGETLKMHKDALRMIAGRLKSPDRPGAQLAPPPASSYPAIADAKPEPVDLSSTRPEMVRPQNRPQ